MILFPALKNEAVCGLIEALIPKIRLNESRLSWKAKLADSTDKSLNSKFHFETAI